VQRNTEWNLSRGRDRSDAVAILSSWVIALVGSGFQMSAGPPLHVKKAFVPRNMWSDYARRSCKTRLLRLAAAQRPQV